MPRAHGALFVSTAAFTSPPIADVAAESRLAALLERIALLLPAQGPLTAFVFLNPLQAFEHLPFDEGVQRGSQLFAAEPYLTEERYREKLARGRMRREDLVAALHDDLGSRGEALVAGLVARHELRLAMLLNPVWMGSAAELTWFIAETDALRRMRPQVSGDVRQRFLERTRRWALHDMRAPQETGRTFSTDWFMQQLLAQFAAHSMEQWSEGTWEAFALHALWKTCEAGVDLAELPVASVHSWQRPRDQLLAAGADDADLLVHETLIRFSAAFTDQGFADWPLPNREEGFFRCFLQLEAEGGGTPESWRRGLSACASTLLQAGTSHLSVIHAALQHRGAPEAEWETYLTASSLALKGWAGLIHQMDVRRDRVAAPVPAGSLQEFLAVRLLLDEFALTHVARTAGVSLADVAVAAAPQPASQTHLAATKQQRAFLLFEIAQLFGWSAPRLHTLPRHAWRDLLIELESFSGLERRRLFHAAFERRFRVQALDALALHAQRTPEEVPRPLFQATFCIDAREESFRRHIEEVHPQVETFGAAGFFVIPMYYRGASDANWSTLCPVVVRPQHWVTEEVVLTLEDENALRARTRKAFGSASHSMHKVSRSAALGALLTASLGVLASVPLVARVLFPRLVSRLQRTASRFIDTPRVTRLWLERTAAVPAATGDGVGFTVTEMAEIAERLLRDIHLVKNFARIVLFLGHGSFCLNNPHKSAYDCGACSGSAGGPNARVLAAFLNDVRVRELLRLRGIEIPHDTHFLGGLHNTCDDTVTFYDLDQLPTRLFADFRAARGVLEEACLRNAHERCRRFDTAPLSLTPVQAHAHVEGRSQDLAQVRPEFGNATNALCFVGRRSRVRGLFLDRRCFLHSYDAAADDDQHTILSRILAAVVPVCSGINLQYYFSYVDPRGWGCDTKLPHNITSLLGVMDGYLSDLRPGLPWQGVEIHEPLRLLFVIEATPAALLQVMERNATVRNILHHGWSQLCLLDPHSAAIVRYENGRFEPYVPGLKHLPTAPSSLDWYRGWRDHLSFAAIQPWSPTQPPLTL